MPESYISGMQCLGSLLDMLSNTETHLSCCDLHHKRLAMLLQGNTAKIMEQLKLYDLSP